MEFDAALNKIVVGKPFGMTMVKGSQGTGKTAAAACRALYLKNSYCLYEDEKILVTANDNYDISLLKRFYEEAKDSYKYDYATLFSLSKQEPVEFCTLDDLVIKYYSIYEKENKTNYRLIEAKEKLQKIKECVDEIKHKYKNVRLMKKCNEEFIIDEINWIKACDIRTLEEYKNSARLGRVSRKGIGPVRLIRNSKSREAIFEIMLLYNEKIFRNNMIDEIDRERLALKAIINNEQGKYTHMVVDNAHKLSRIQLNILMSLKSSKAYSSMMLMVNHKAEPSDGSWITKGRKQKDLEFNTSIKSCYLKKNFMEFVRHEALIESDSEIGSKREDCMEKYVYVDMRHKRNFQFLRDTSNYDELILTEEKEDILCGKNELVPIPVYSNIAAGEPITINPDRVDTFNLPQYWVKGMKDCFMLKVKGDSMIGADIDDGDFVVIRKQNTASNRDIVAVDIEGSATLKRLWLGKEEVLLMPENEKYSPIPIKDRDAVILGVVIGIIKNAA